MRLFKYYAPSEYSFKSLAVKGLWCHNAVHMNDPFDCLGFVNRNHSNSEISKYRDIIADKGSEKIKRILKYSNHEISKIINEHRKKSIEKYAFCALSESPDQILMWSHYAKAHTGFVIEFEFPELLNNHHLQKVSYLTSLPNFDLEKFGNFIVGDRNLMGYVFQDFSLKSAEWSYEREWRIWRKYPTYYHYKAENVKGIYFGVNTDSDTQQTVIELVNYLSDDIPVHTYGFSDNPVRLVTNN